MASDKLSPAQVEAITTADGTRVLVRSMNREINVLRRTVVKTQNELEGWRSRYDNVDKDNGILRSQLDFFIGIEIFKYLLSAVVTAYGINLVTSKDSSGWAYVVSSAIAYGLITLWQKSKSPKSK